MQFRDIGYSCRKGWFILKKGQVWDSVILCFTMSVGCVVVYFNSALRCIFVLFIFKCTVDHWTTQVLRSLPSTSWKSPYNFLLYSWPCTSVNSTNHQWKTVFSITVWNLWLWVHHSCKSVVEYQRLRICSWEWEKIVSHQHLV